jgi:alkylation response protein AidB-like acyl-CoA dehydrogenase
VDFQLSPEEEEFRDATAKLCAGRMPISKLRTLTGLDRSLWGELEASGVFALRAEPGLGASATAVVFEQLARGLVPGPLIWTLLAGPTGLEGIVGGVEEPATGGVHVLEHLPDLDHLVVLGPDGLRRIDPASVEASPVERPLDPLTPVWLAERLPAGEPIGGAEEAARWRLEGACFAAVQLAGLAGALTDMTVAYTAERRQFGRPVGSFQSIKHLLADMLVRSELARTQAFAAAVHLDEPELGGVGRSVSSAKSVAGRAAITNGRVSIQAHGGMGFTWEVDVHLYTKRAWLLDSLFGTADAHAEAVAATL